MHTITKIRFHLRTLAVAVLALSLLLAFVVRPAMMDKHAFEMVRQGGGQIALYDSTGTDEASVFSRRFSHTTLHIGFTAGVGPSARQGMRLLSNIDSVWIEGEEISDWSFLQSCENVNRITIFDADDKIFPNLSRATDLKCLEIGGTGLTGKGIEDLRFLPNLESLRIFYASLSDAILVEINKLQGLRRLELIGVPITDLGISHLTSLQSLEALELRETKITPACLEGIAGLKSLVELHLYCSTEFTEQTTAAFQHLQGSKLRVIHASSLILGPDGRPEIADLFPGCKIEVVPPVVTMSGGFNGTH